MNWIDTRLLRITCRQLKTLPVILVALVFVSAISVTWVTHLNRQSNTQLQQALMAQEDLQEQWSRLLLQHGYETSPEVVEKQARDDLNMGLPEKTQIVMVQP